MEHAKMAQQTAQDRMAKGPEVFASVRLGGIGSMAGHITIQVLTQFLCAFLATWLLLNTKATLSYGGRVVFLTAIALTVAVAAHLPDWNWWSFSAAYTAAQFVDLLVGWTLAGLVIAKFAK